MTELAALNIKITGDAGDLKTAIAAANGDLAKLVSGAQAAGLKVKQIPFAPAAGNANNFSHSLRGVSQQLSQVGQQTMATGNFVQALAIQLPDIGLAFGAVGAAAGLLAGIALPMVVSAMFGAGAESDALKTKQEALKEAIESVTASTQKYQTVRAMAASGAILESEQTLLTEINGLTAQRVALEAQLLALAADQDNALSAEAAAENLSLLRKAEAIRASIADLDVALNRLDAERDIDIATRRRANEARNAYREEAAALAQQNASLTAAYGVYAKTRAEGEKLAGAAADAGLAASDLSHIAFGNISSAASEALRLAGNLGIALDTASRLAALGPQGIGGNDPSGGTYSGRGGAPSRGDIVGMRLAGSMGYNTPPSANAGGAGGGGGRNMADELASFQDTLATEAELELQSFATRQQNLREFLDARMITQQEYAGYMEDLQRQHQDKMGSIDAYRYGSGILQAETFMGDMAAAFSAGGEQMQQASRAFAATEALINAWRAYSQTLADPSIPFLAKFAAGAKVLAAGMGAVNAIRGGGGAASTGGASVATAAQPSQSPMQVNLNTYGFGDFIAKADLSGLLDKLGSEAGDRGYKLMWAGS